MLTTIGLIIGLGMGIMLGLIGAGGSIITTPIFVYFFGLKPWVATCHSLLVVGIVALIGTVRYSLQQQVDFRSALLFAIPALLSVLVARTLVVPLLPDVFQFEMIEISKDTFIMLLFGLLMCASAFLTYFYREPNLKSTKAHNKILLCSCSLTIGFITGMIGAGGGFLIVPSLLYFFNLSMKNAIGTSLAIITINSLAGFCGDFFKGFIFQWELLLPFLMVTVMGMWIGTKVNKQLPLAKLKAVFALFTLAVGILVIGQQLLNLIRIQ